MADPPAWPPVPVRAAVDGASKQAGLPGPTRSITEHGRGIAVVLFSGGLDSTTLLAQTAQAGFEVYALSVDYGQRNAIELQAAARIAEDFGVARHVVATIDPIVFGSSALTNRGTDLGGRVDDSGNGLPATYVPGRNGVFLALAAAWAESVGSRHIYIGVTAGDSQRATDCSPEFVESFARSAALARGGRPDELSVVVHAPLINMTKPEIISLGLCLGVDFGATHTCYDPVGTRPCRRCDACLARRYAFASLGLADPALSSNDLTDS